MLMKFLFSLFLLLVSFVSIASPPDWYLKQNIVPENKYTYIGYGAGKNLQQAKQAAREDISSQLLVVVDSQMDIEKELSNGEFTTSARSSSKQRTFARLRDLRVIESGVSDNNYYVALEYQHLSLSQYFLKKLNLATCKNENQHPYLEQTPLFNELNDDLPCHLDVKLTRKNKTWLLEYKETLIQLYKEGFSQLYANVHTAGLHIIPSSNRLMEGDQFDVTIRSEKKGYVTLFNVYSDGIVSLLQENLAVNAGGERKFPMEKDEVVFEAAVLEQGKESVDMYIGIFSAGKLNYSRFREANSATQNNETQYQFDRLLKIMRDREFSAVLLRIQPAS